MVDRPEPLPLIPRDSGSRVDGARSCNLCYEYTTPRGDSGLCDLHNSRVEEIVASGKLTNACMARTARASVEFALPIDPAQAEWVRSVYDSLLAVDKSQVWIIDAEGVGATCTGFASIGTEFGIVNWADEDIQHSGHIKYTGHSTASAVYQEIRRHELVRSKTGGLSTHAAGIVNGILGRHYNGDNALTLRLHKKKLCDGLGFDEETAIVVKWGHTKLDMDTLGRILHNKNEIALDQAAVATKCTTINLLDLYQMYTGTYNRGSLGLSILWSSLFPRVDDLDLAWHTALVDAKAERNLLSLFVKGITEFIQSEEADEDSMNTAESDGADELDADDSEEE